MGDMYGYVKADGIILNIAMPWFDDVVQHPAHSFRPHQGTWRRCSGPPNLRVAGPFF